MKSGLFLLLPLFFIAIFGHAETTDNHSNNTLEEISPKQHFVENLCIPVCMKLAQVENTAAYNKFKPNCEKAYDNQELLKTWEGQLQYHGDTIKNLVAPCAAQAVRKAIVDPVVFIINLFTRERQGNQPLYLSSFHFGFYTFCRLAGAY